MSLVPEPLRPYLAGLLGVVATGLGHLYLRRWLRAVGWLALAFVVTVVFVPEEALVAMSEPGAGLDRAALLPTAAVQLVGAGDAFLVAYRSSSAGRGDGAPAVVEGEQADAVSCPNCGREVDGDMGFCHWCTTEFATPESE